MKGLLLFWLCLLALQALVRAEFVLVVNLVDYTNPTGLCAECQTTLDQVNSVDELVPVCCDQLPFTSENCDNTGDSRCDTRFRWRIRPYGSSLESRPASIPNAKGTPPYNFTDCRLSDMCPSSEMSITFGQGPTGLLGVTANPVSIQSRQWSFIEWTGRIQFFIEATDSYLPNIIDSLLVNLDLQLGADFTEERTYSGYHNISHMTMSFRVECASGYCGNNCTIKADSPHVVACQTNGNFECRLPRRDPATYCTLCLHPERYSDADCNVCVLRGGDPETQCTTCRDTRADPNENCTITIVIEPTLSVGVVAGVMTVLVVIILVLSAVVILLIIYIKAIKNRSETETVEDIQLSNNPDEVNKAQPPPSADTDAIKLQSNVLYGVNITADQTTYYENEGLVPPTSEHHQEYDYVQV